jgi:hypothetical protein
VLKIKNKGSGKKDCTILGTPIRVTGWVCEKIAQNVAQHSFCHNLCITLAVERSRPKFRPNSLLKQEQAFALWLSEAGNLKKYYIYGICMPMH